MVCILCWDGQRAVGWEEHYGGQGESTRPRKCSTLISPCHQIHIAKGWQPGQHVRLQVFFSGRISELHPLIITNAPSPVSVIPSQTLLLAAKAKGDWTRALNTYAIEEQARLMTLLTGTAAEQPYDSVVSTTAISSHSGIQPLRDTSGGLIETTMLSCMHE